MDGVYEMRQSFWKKSLGSMAVISTDFYGILGSGLEWNSSRGGR